MKISETRRLIQVKGCYGDYMPVGQFRVAHVGLGKTASTFLQKRFFSEIDMPVFSTDPSSHWPEELNWLRSINRVWMKDFYTERLFWSRKEREAYFCAQVDQARESWVLSGKEFVEKSGGALLLSAEGLCGFSIPVAKYIGNLLHDIGIEKIIFVFRGQADWSISLWRQLILAEDRFARYVSFEDLFGNMSSDGKCAPLDMDWMGYLNSYREIFGAQNVLAVPYERLVHEAPMFFEEVSRFMGVKSKRLPDFSQRENLSQEDNFYLAWKMGGDSRLLRAYPLRMLLHNKKRSFLSLCFKKEPITNFNHDFRIKIMQHFRDSNQELSNQTGYNLASYGYF